MKRIISFILPAAAAFLFACCTDSGLGDRIDSLESRIVALEKNLGTLNDNVVALQAIVNGGVVTEVKEKDGVYTIVFSDGRTVTLAQGSTGVATAPVMGIDGDGFWTVSYDGGKTFEQVKRDGQPVKAVGTDGVTPKFGVDSEGYWTVSYDGGKTAERVKDADGNPVKAVAEAGGSTPVADSWFSSVDAKGGKLVVVLKDGTTTFELPIASGFVCAIKGAEDVITFAYGETRTFDVELKGAASVMVSAPQDWKASFADPTLTVTAPAAATKALSADSDTDVCLLAISEGGVTALAKLRVKVSAGSATDPDTPVYTGLYARYMAGEEVEIAEVKVSKAAYPDANYISSTSEDKTLKSGVNFVEADVVAEFPAGKGNEIVPPFFVVGNTEGTRTSLKATAQVQFNSTATIENNVIGLQNVELGTDGITEGYLIANMLDNAMNRISFKDCRINLVGDKSLMYMAATRPVNTFVVEDCDVKCNSTKSSENNLLKVSGADYTMAELTFTNNVFWSDSETGTKSFSLYLDRKAAVTKLTVTHNTFVNVYPQASYAYCQINDMVAGDLSNNLFYFKDYAAATVSVKGDATYTGIVKEETASNVVEDDYAAFNNNYAIYAVETIPAQKLKLGQNAKTTNIVSKKQSDASEVFDFTDDSENFNIAKGIFKPKKAEYGAQR